MGTAAIRLIAIAIALISLSCTGEEPVEIDLRETVPPTSAVEESDDPNAAEKARLQELAEQQCLDDPSLSEGTVRIVDPSTGEVVSELVLPCEEVRNP